VSRDILADTLKSGRKALSEHESKELLRNYGIPVTREMEVNDEGTLLEAVKRIGFPLVLKACAPDLLHKTEGGLVYLNLYDTHKTLEAFRALSAKMGSTVTSVLVQEMVLGERELVIGLTRDPQFGPCVMFGLGGIFSEVLKDTSFRVAPLEKQDALEMMSDIQGRGILESIRGIPPVDLDPLADILIQIGTIGLSHPEIREIDINPLIIAGSTPVAADALVVLA